MGMESPGVAALVPAGAALGAASWALTPSGMAPEASKDDFTKSRRESLFMSRGYSVWQQWVNTRPSVIALSDDQVRFFN
jgi:hypothetical protein